MNFRPLANGLISRFLCSVCLWMSATAVVAQEQEKAEKPEAPAVDETDQSEWERLIYVPYKNLKQVFEKETATVFMPYAEFLKLWGNRGAGGNKTGQPPVGAVISRADYVGTVVKDLAHVKATFTVRVLGKPWAEIPLSFGDAAVGKMTASHESILLRGTGEGTYSLLLPESGEHTVTLELVSRIRTSPDGRSFSLQCPPVGITNFELTVPAADQTVEITPHLVSTPIKTEGNTTRVEAGLGATKQISARWFPRVSTAPEMDLLASVENTIDIRVADGLIHSHASLVYKILRGRLDQVRIVVPSDHRILDVAAPSLKGWQAAKDQAGQIITVELLPGKARTITVDVHTERPVPDATFSLAGVDPNGKVHGIHTMGAVRESGVIAVGHTSDITLPIEKQTGLVRIESTEIPEALRRRNGKFFKFYTHDFELTAVAKPVEPRIVATQQTRFEFRDDELHLDATIGYEVERAGIFELRYRLPEGFTVETVESESMDKWSVAAESNELVVALNRKTLGQFVIEISGHVDFRAGREETKLKLPLLVPQGVARETGTIQIFAPEAIEVITADDDVIAAQPIRPRNVSTPRNMRLTSAWSYSRQPVEITVTTLRKPTRLTASVGTKVDVKQELVEVNAILDYRVQYAGIDTFVFAVPESVGDVQIEQLDAGSGTAIKQRSKAEEADEGWVAWTVVMQHNVMGHQKFSVKYDLKPEQADEKSAVTIEPPRVLPTPANEKQGTLEIVPARIYGEVAVMKDRALTIDAATETLEPIDVRELKSLPHDANLAYRYFKQPVQVALTAAKHEIQEVVETVVSRALIEAVVSEDEPWTYRCRFRITSSQRQRLSLSLPAHAELLGMMVAGKKGVLERDTTTDPQPGWDAYFVNVARTGGSDEPFGLTVVFRVESGALKNWGGSLSAQIPRIGGPEATVPVQQLRVAVWVPDDFSLVGTPKRFSNDRDPILTWSLADVSSARNTQTSEKWIGEGTAGLFEFPTAGRAYTYKNLGGTANLTVTYWRSSIYTLVISGTVFIVSLLLRRTTWHNKLSVLVIAAFAVAIAGVRWPDVVMHAVSAALPGIAAMFVIWFVHGLFQIRPHHPHIEEAKTALFPMSVAAVVPPPGIFKAQRDTFERPTGDD